MTQPNPFRYSLMLLFAASLLPAQPSAAATAAAAAPTAPDPHSRGNPQEIAGKHLDLDLAVDFDRQLLSGSATWTLERVRPDATRFVVDARGLDIRKVTLQTGGQAVAFKLGAPDPLLGSALEIPITAKTRQVRIEYATRPDAAALQWLSPQQTAGGKRPFLFTQSQSILARTWIPCQDSPGVRFSYTAKIRVPADLLAVMSAENPIRKSADGVYQFRMPQPVPSYLMALSVGDLEFRPLGPQDGRAGVYAEPSMVEKAAWEFADTEKMIAAAEKLYGPYRWGRYDLLVLPPSFPFGGMENPRLTFATPTILAGDRSLVSLVAHELAHSWSGNLVTNATWNDFWLNEGFTVYFEERITEAVYGKELATMEASLELAGLRETVARMGADNPDTRLAVDFTGRDPDDGVGDIAYQKGRFFLRAVEQAVGRERFDAFLRDYFDRFAFQTMTTEKFVAFLRSNLLDHSPQGKAFDIDGWVYKPGLPPIDLAPTDAFTKVDRELERLASGTKPAELDTKTWVTQQWMRFIRTLPSSATATDLAALDATFHFTDSGNSEVATAWFLRAIAANYEPAKPKLEQFLRQVGRRKFLLPLYTALAKTPEGKAWALKIYGEARAGYHSVSRNSIDEVLGVAKG